MKTRRISVLLAALAVTSPTWAEEAPRADEIVQPGSGRLGFGASFKNGKVRLWSCKDACEQGAPSLSLDLPTETKPVRRSVERLPSAVGDALWIRYGDAKNFYSLLIVGRSDASMDAPPRVLLKGWSGQASSSRTQIQPLESKGRQGLLVSSARKNVICGREIPTRTRFFDPDKAQFKTVAAPPLGATEREGALKLEAVVLPTDAKRLLLSLDGQSPGRAMSPAIDGDTGSVWDSGHAYVELKPIEGVPLNELVLQIKGGDPSAVYVATTSKLYEVRIPAGAGRVVVSLPLSDDPCVAVVQPQAAAPITEVFGTAVVEVVPETGALVADLEKGDPGLAVRALRARGPEGISNLAAAFPRMSDLARRRALDVALVAPGVEGVDLLLATIEYGARDHSREAFEHLVSLGMPAVPLVVAGLNDASPDREAKLVATLTKLSEKSAAQELPRLLEAESSVRRQAVRRALSQLANTKEGGAELQALVVQLAAGKREDLSRAAQIELVRALGPVLSEWKGSTALVEALARGANFSEAYRLAPHALQLSKGSKVLQESWGRWLSGAASGEVTATQSAALSVRLLEAMRDTEGLAKSTSTRAAIAQLLESKNMRVRRAALGSLTAEKAYELHEAVIDLLSSDDWPEVRAVAAEASVATTKDPAKSEDLSRLLARRLGRDTHETVRRALARSLIDAPSETGRKSLRRAFEKDESYLVRAEAAVALGRLCDQESLEDLTRAARVLGAAPMNDGPIELGLSAVTALAHLSPEDLDDRLAPLFSEKVSGVTRHQVKRRLEAVKAAPGGPACGR